MQATATRSEILRARNAATRQHEIAQGNALGYRAQRSPKPCKGEIRSVSIQGRSAVIVSVPNNARDMIPNGYAPDVAPFQGWKPIFDHRNPGRCPGLSHSAPLGLAPYLGPVTRTDRSGLKLCRSSGPQTEESMPRSVSSQCRLVKRR
jgi:hypothetical protein